MESEKTKSSDEGGNTDPCEQQGVVVPVESSDINVFSYFGSTDVSFFSKEYNIIYVSAANLLYPSWFLVVAVTMWCGMMLLH